MEKEGNGAGGEGTEVACVKKFVLQVYGTGKGAPEPSGTFRDCRQLPDGKEFFSGLPGGARPVIRAVVEAVDGRLSGLVETERDFAEYFLLLYAGFAGC